jgi:hypothetical protein
VLFAGSIDSQGDSNWNGALTINTANEKRANPNR